MLIGIIVCFVMALAATWLAGIQHIIGAPLLLQRGCGAS